MICPYCGRVTQEEETVCRKCHGELPKPEPERETEPEKKPKTNTRSAGRGKEWRE